MAPTLENGNCTDTNGAQLEYANKSRPYVHGTCDYSSQFCQMYSFRLAKMTQLLKSKVQQKWGNNIPIKKLCELREDVPDKCIIIGTIFKHQKYKPSILREISEINQLAPQPSRTYYVDDDDKLILEDELQRIRLSGKINVHNIVTGVSCGVLGYVESDGVFLVEDFIFFEGGPQKPLMPWVTSPLLVLISGLDLIQLNVPGGKYRESVEKLKEWLSGEIINYGDEKRFSSQHVVRVVVAGNSIRTKPEEKKKNLLVRMPEYPDTVQAVKYLDTWCADWCKETELDVMPGEFDPTNYLLPQQPLHNCLFDLACKHETFRSVTNPYKFEFGDRLISGTSGQNIHDILRTSKITDPLEALRLVLQWSHLAPTCPDTLGCYPYVDKDPFIITECPHVFFSGNIDEYKTDVFEGTDGQKTRLICIPSFSKMQSVVVVDLSTLESHELSFKIK